MDLACFIHEPKSPLSYASDAETLHIRVKTKRDDLKSITVLAMDPFNWKPVSRDSHVYEFAVDQMQRVEMKKEYVTRYHDCWFAELTGFNWRRIKYGFVLDDGRPAALPAVSGLLRLPGTGHRLRITRTIIIIPTSLKRICMWHPNG